MSGIVVLPADVAKSPGRLDALESMCPQVTVQSGDYVAVPDAAPLEIVDGSIEIGYTQAGSGDPSPSNVRNISGWTSIPIHHTGKNLIPKGVNNSDNGIDFTVRADGSVYFKGTATGNSASSHYTQGYMPKGDMILTGMLGSPSQTGLEYVYRLQLLDWDRNVIKRQYNSTPQSFSLDKPQTVRCYIPGVEPGAVLTGSVVQPMARVEDFADATFEGYQGEDITVEIPDFIGTVCAGRYNPVTGKLTVDRVYVEYDETVSVTVKQTGTSNWYYEFPQIPMLAKGTTSSSNLAAAELISNKYVSTNITSTNTNQGFGLVENSNGTVTPRLRHGSQQTPAAFAESLEDNHIQLSYLLATPIVYQISKAPIVLYVGANTIWSETGAMGLTYQASPYYTLLGRIADLQALVLENMGG